MLLAARAFRVFMGEFIEERRDEDAKKRNPFAKKDGQVLKKEKLKGYR